MKPEVLGHPARNGKTLPARAGAGFKVRACRRDSRDSYRIGFLEVHAENYMGAGGLPHRLLSRMREQFRSPCMASDCPSARERHRRVHLSRLKSVVERYEPEQVSEHLAWSTHDDSYFTICFPSPTTASLDRVCDHIDLVQSVLGRKILLENPSTYALFERSTMSETDFIREIAAAPAAACCWTSTTCWSRPSTTASSADVSARFSARLVEEIHLAAMPRTRTKTERAADRRP